MIRAERFFTEPEDRGLAEVSDFQGVGGKHAHNQPDRQLKKATDCVGPP